MTREQIGKLWLLMRGLPTPNKNMVVEYVESLISKAVDNKVRYVIEDIKNWEDSTWINVQFPAHTFNFESVDRGGIKFSGEVVDIVHSMLLLPSLIINK